MTCAFIWLQINLYGACAHQFRRKKGFLLMYSKLPLQTSEIGARASHIELPPHLRKPRLRRSETSEYLRLVYGVQVAPATLAKWACYGEGPVMDYVNRTPLYPVAELDDWALRKLKKTLDKE